MNNNDNMNNDPILDWILQTDTTEDTSKPISTELLSFLLSQNGNSNLIISQPQQQQVSPENTNSAHLTSSPSEEDDEPTDAQLKMMPSKERRQLRNKISARNFRNRRKEYMATLEAEMDQCKAENSQLKHEVKWVRGMMDKLQAENDKLRLQLVLCKEGIEPSRKNTETIVNVSPTTPSDVMSLLNNNDNSSWDILYPPVVTNTNTNNIYLAHAFLPDWDMSNIYEKKNHRLNIPTEKIDLIRTYPLLAPALMSIVLNHTMTMTTDEIISNSTLYDPTWATPSSNEKCALFDPVVWQKFLELQQKESTNASAANVPEKQISQVSYFVQNYCPLYWIQKQFCNFVISYVVVRYPHLDTKCRTYLPICEKFRKRRITQFV